MRSTNSCLLLSRDTGLTPAWGTLSAPLRQSCLGSTAVAETGRCRPLAATVRGICGICGIGSRTTFDQALGCNVRPRLFAHACSPTLCHSGFAGCHRQRESVVRALGCSRRSSAPAHGLFTQAGKRERRAVLGFAPMDASLPRSADAPECGSCFFEVTRSQHHQSQHHQSQHHQSQQRLPR
jgi:hypothetical protein